MDKTMKKRRNNRLVWTFFIALAFAVIPPMAYLTPLQNVFMRSEEAIRYGALFSGTVRWIHAGAIAAVWLLNMLFFYQNEKIGVLWYLIMEGKTAPSFFLCHLYLYVLF